MALKCIIPSKRRASSGSDGKESACSVGDPGSIPGLGRSPGQPTPVFLPGESHGQRSQAGYNLWDRTELETTKVT